VITRRIFTLALSLVLAFTFLAGCGSTTKEAYHKKPAEPPKTENKAPEVKKTTYPLTVKDAAGREVTIKAEPKRIVSVAPSNTELVFALGKGSSLVGRSDWCDYPAEAKNIATIGNMSPPNYEKILSTNPDLILMISGSKDAREKLAGEFKLPVYVVDPQTFDEVYEGVKNLGIVLNAQEQAEKVVADLQKGVKEITDKTAKAQSKPKVFYEVWDDPLMTAGTGTFIDDMIRLSGGVNVGAEVKGWADFSKEKLAAANPDIYIGSMAGTEAKIKGRAGWEGLKAVKENKVFAVADANVVSRPGPRLVLGLKWFAETVHPELFGK